jgi:hypothetical protein
MVLADWPLRALLLAVLVAMAASACAARHSYQALGALWAVVRRRIPRRLIWVMPRARWRIMTAVAAALASSFLVTRWVQARVQQSTTLGVPTQVDVPAGFLHSVREPDAATWQPAPPAIQSPAPQVFVRMILPALERQGLTHAQAVLFAAHLARETGWGRWVRCNNYGNVKAGSGWTGETFWMTDARGFRDQYRAWPTLDQGIQSTLALIRDSARYRKAWRLLRAGDLRWYGQLGLDGYYEGPTGHARDGSRFHTEHDLSTVLNVQREYEQIVNLVRRYDAGAG